MRAWPLALGTGLAELVVGSQGLGASIDSDKPLYDRGVDDAELSPQGDRVLEHVQWLPGVRDDDDAG